MTVTRRSEIEPRVSSGRHPPSQHETVASMSRSSDAVCTAARLECQPREPRDSTIFECLLVLFLLTEDSCLTTVHVMLLPGSSCVEQLANSVSLATWCAILAITTFPGNFWRVVAVEDITIEMMLVYKSGQAWICVKFDQYNFTVTHLFILQQALKRP